MLAAVLLTFFLTLYALYILMFFINQEKRIFSYHKIDANHTFKYDFGFEEFWFDVEPSVKLHGLAICPPKPDFIVIYFHGRKGHMGRSGKIYKRLKDHNCAVYLFDYRGYGKSEGTINSDKQFYEDSLKAYDYITAKHPRLPVVLYGHSMGNTPALYVAKKRKHDKLILENPYFSLLHIIKNHYWYLPISFILRYPFRNYLLIKELNSPILILHGKQDPIVPVQHAEALAKLAKNAHLTIIEEGAHNDLADFDEFHQSLQAFLGSDSEIKGKNSED